MLSGLPPPNELRADALLFLCFRVLCSFSVKSYIQPERNALHVAVNTSRQTEQRLFGASTGSSSLVYSATVEFLRAGSQSVVSAVNILQG